MSTLTEQQIEQIGNVFNTLLEAADHLQGKVKSHEYTQSLYTFSSIVEGYAAISEYFILFEDEKMNRLKKQVDQSMPLIIQAFEQENLLKVNEILQFSFIPAMRKTADQIAATIKKDDQIVIGIFHSISNPKDFYPEPRLQALIGESKKQQTKLLFFTSEDVDFETMKIEADYFEESVWKRETLPFPDVIHNAGVGKQSQVERKLRRHLPFTNFHVGNKFTLPKRMLEHKKYAELLVPFIICMNKESIHRFLEENNKAVFKALGSNRGEDIYFITKKGQRYAIAEHTKERIMAKAEFDRWLDTIILAEKGSYIIQRFILTRTKADEPYHFRAHVQKDGDGQWILTHIYPRIGNKKSHLSNIATDGRVEDFHEFMLKEFEENGPKYEKDILTLSLEVAKHLDKLYGFAISELGLDFAIDETGRYWMHEANNGPQTAYHEEKRAVHTIAYAKYMAEQGIFYDELIQKSRSGFFQARQSQLPYFEANEQKILGILVTQFTEDESIQAIVEEAKQQELVVCVFRPKDIDYDYELSKAHFWDNGAWSERITEYPELLFDYSQIRNVKDAKWVYEELANIPFINEWGSESLKKNEVLSYLQVKKDFQSIMPNYTIIESRRDITRKLENFQQVLIQRNDWRGIGQISIEKLSKNQYRLIKGSTDSQQNHLQLMNNFKENLTRNNYIVLEDTRSKKEEKRFIIYTDLIVEKEGWSIIGNYAVEELGETEEALSYLHSIYGEEQSIQFLEDIQKLSKEVAKSLYEEYGKVITIISVGISITDQHELKLLDIEPNKVANIYDATAFAKGIVKRAKDLLEETVN